VPYLCIGIFIPELLMKIKSAHFLYVLYMSVFFLGCKKDSPVIETRQQIKVTVTTLAGEGSADFENGPFLTSKFRSPGDVIFSVDGLYLTDIENHRIRKISAGFVSTYAGTDEFGILNGPGASAQFENPFSIATDPQGNLFTTDENDPRIREISVEAVASVLAGTEHEGFRDGGADSAQFSSGDFIVADDQKNIYVSDGKNNRVRKISRSGQVTTIAGNGKAGFKDGTGTVAEFNYPGGITIDHAGNLYIVDRGNLRIRKITPAGNVSTIAGTGKPGRSDGHADTAEFSIEMRDMVIDDKGNLFFCDDHRIRELTSDGIVLTIAGSTPGFADGDGANAKFNFPNGLAIDPLGTIYVADLNNNRIRRISF
jgi:DNA-binding beta-propeller fold protein YncE